MNLTFPEMWRNAFFLIILLLPGCGPGISDFSEHLGDEYYLISNNSLDKTIMKKEKYVVGNLVIDYWSNKEYIVAIRLIGKNQFCKVDSSYKKSLSDILEYWIINKKKQLHLRTKNVDTFNFNIKKYEIPNSKLNVSKKNRVMKTYRELGMQDYFEKNSCTEVLDREVYKSVEMSGKPDPRKPEKSRKPGDADVLMR